MQRREFPFPPGPPGPAPRPPRPPRSRPPLELEWIVDVTLGIIDAEGIEAVTMRRLARELGVTASSLYQHVSSREGVLALAHERVREEIGGMPDTGDLHADLRAHHLHMHRVLSAHGDIAHLDFAAAPSGVGDLADLEHMLERLLAAGVSGQRATWGVDRLLLYTAADVYETWLFARRTGPELAEWMTRVREFTAGGGENPYPHVTELMGSMRSGGVEDRFLLGLDLLLDGLLG